MSSFHIACCVIFKSKMSGKNYRSEKLLKLIPGLEGKIVEYIFIYIKRLAPAIPYMYSSIVFNRLYLNDI